MKSEEESFVKKPEQQQQEQKAEQKPEEVQQEPKERTLNVTLSLTEVFEILSVIESSEIFKSDNLMSKRYGLDSTLMEVYKAFSEWYTQDKN